MQIVKRDGTRMPFDGKKIFKVLEKAGLGKDEQLNVYQSVMRDLVADSYHVDDIHDIVQDKMESVNLQAASNYRDYRYQREDARTFKHVGKGALSEYILHSKYAHPSEDWEDVVDRVLDMHQRTLNIDCKDLRTDLVLKKVLPSMRSLQFGGEAIEVNNARMYNCSFSLCDRLSFFSEAFFLLLSGCGVGYSVSKEHVNKLPELTYSRRQVVLHRVTDTIEGWAEAADRLVQGATQGDYVEFDYSQIRPEGSILHTTKGVAPGHVPLKIALENVRSLLDSANGRRLTPFECHRIVCFLAEGVLSGGIRRSSLICLFDQDDTEMFNCKRGEWFNTYPELRLSNNSVIIKNADANFWESMVVSMMEYGEPGYFATKSNSHGTNPCGEIGLDPVINEQTGFAFCNLTEVDVSKCASEADLLHAVQQATILGTIQASYTDFPFLESQSQAIAKENALLGVSMTGIQEAKITLSDELLRACSKRAVETNVEYSKILGINPAKRVTCVKPSGTASLFLGTTPGIHPAHSKWFFRRVTANKNEPVFQEFMKVNPHMCEQKPDGDWVITFPMWSGGKTRHDMDAKQMIEEVTRFYKNWILPAGTKDLTHNVSCTITVKDEEREFLKSYLNDHYHEVQAMSFLPDYGDVVYPFAPFQEVRSVADMARWIELARWYRPVDYKEGVSDFGAACEGPSCEI